MSCKSKKTQLILKWWRLVCDGEEKMHIKSFWKLTSHHTNTFKSSIFNVLEQYISKYRIEYINLFSKMNPFIHVSSNPWTHSFAFFTKNICFHEWTRLYAFSFIHRFLHERIAYVHNISLTSSNNHFSEFQILNMYLQQNFVYLLDQQ